MLDNWVAGQIGAAGKLTREELDAWQLARLRAVVDDARRRSPFYRDHLPEGAIRTLRDFAALPFTTPDHLRLHGGRMLCVPPDDVTRIVTLATSGSTGAPKRVCATAGDQERTVDFFRHGMGEFVRPGDVVMSLFPGASEGSLNDLLGKGLAAMGCRLHLFGFPTPETYGALLDEILALGVVSLVGPPSAIAAAARFSAEQGRAAALSAQVESVLLAADHVSPDQRAAIAAVWNCRVNEHYGMTETGFTGAVSCPRPGGYHIWESGLYCEIVHPATGLPLPPGERGEIVVTTLLREAMPLIRYRTGDRSRFLPQPCPCGSLLRRLERVQARPQPKKFVSRRIPDTLD